MKTNNLALTHAPLLSMLRRAGEWGMELNGQRDWTRGMKISGTGLSCLESVWGSTWQNGSCWSVYQQETCSNALFVFSCMQTAQRFTRRRSGRRELRFKHSHLYMKYNWPIGSPSPRTQTSQWQSSISCTRSGTRTSLGFGAIEKHWKMRSSQSHRFYGVASKMQKWCAWDWDTYNTDSRYPQRMGNIIYFNTFPESKQNRSKCP